MAIGFSAWDPREEIKQKEYMADLSRKSHLIKQLINWRVLLMAAILSGVQLYLWPDAGKQIESRRYIYSFEMDQWLQEVYNSFNLIRGSGTYRDISLTTGAKTLTPEYLANVEEYLYQARQLLQALRYRGKVTTDVMADINSLMSKEDVKIIDQAIREKITLDFKTFSELAHKQVARENAIAEFELEWRKVTAGIHQDADSQQKVAYEVQKINTLRKLYSDENLMVTHFQDPFKFVRDFNIASQNLLNDYDALVTQYNEIREGRDRKKTALIYFLGLISVYLTMKEANNFFPAVNNKNIPRRRFSGIRR